MSKHLVLLLLVASLGACSIQPPPSTVWTRWVCDSQAELYWRPDGTLATGVEVRLGTGDRLYHLSRQPSGSGTLYSNSVLGLHVKGGEGLVYWVANNDLIGRGCKTPGN